MRCRMQTAASYRAPCQGHRRHPGLRTARSRHYLPSNQRTRYSRADFKTVEQPKYYSPLIITTFKCVVQTRLNTFFINIDYHIYYVH